MLELDQTAGEQRGCKMKPHKRLHVVHEEWHGLRDFNDIVGGVAGRDKKFGNNLEKHVESNHCSRTKGVAAAIEEHCKQNRIVAADACMQ